MANRKSLLLVAMVFILPVLLAKLALDYDWFNRAATNKGELLQPSIDISLLYASQSSPRTWRILYVIPARCGQPCQNALYSLNQVWLALGRDNDRVVPLAVTTSDSDAAASKWLSQYPAIHILASTEPCVNRVFEQHTRQGIYVVDTLHNMILRYPLEAHHQQAVLHSRDILADVRKLLKLSHIG